MRHENQGIHRKRKVNKIMRKQLDVDLNTLILGLINCLSFNLIFEHSSSVGVKLSVELNFFHWRHFGILSILCMDKMNLRSGSLLLFG